MALTVNFWTFSKRENSTAIPSGSPARTLSCTLKTDSGILSPVLEIGLGMSFDPAALNYAQIPSYSRYYFVSEWQWSGGLWVCSLEVDPLASYKTEIGSASKYILRSAYTYNPDIIDTLYPAEEHVNLSWDSYSFPFSNDFTNGVYVLGVINGEGTSLAGSTEYYILTSPELRDFMTYLFPSGGIPWQSLQAMDEYLYKSIYDPLQFIVSCKYFPFSAGGLYSAEQIAFGNFVSTKYAEPLGKPDTWPVFTHDYTLPSGWTSRDARDRSEPYANIFFWMNPFGVIRLSTSDFTLTDTVRVKITPDLISGEACIQIYAVISGSEYLVAQQTGMLGYDVNLTAVNKDSASAVASIVGGGALAAGKLLAGDVPGAIVSGLVSAGHAFTALTEPSISASTRGSPSVAMLDGASRLYTRRHTFVDSHVAEFGRPLYEVRQISTIPGYIKCGDGDISIPGFSEENARIEEYLKSGFYYE